MGLGVYIIMMKESRGVSLAWANLNEPAIPGDGLTILWVMLMMLLNCVIYLIITWYVTLAFPGEYGVPLPAYFPFTKNYWFGKADAPDGEYWVDDTDLTRDYGDNRENIEQYPRNLKVGVSIRKLAKTYNGGKTYSVDGLTLDTFNSQITALLGHNGAGKTTTISILVGLFQPTKGTAVINGYDIRHEMPQIRESLGICPQHNVLFDDLTVEEHLEFFCKLKRNDLSDQEIKAQVKEMIEKLDLVDKTKVFSKKLSGGMKRKLSVSEQANLDPQS